MASVKITGLTKYQANALAIMCERGDLTKFINDDLDRVNLSGEKIEEDNIPTVDFGDDYDYDFMHVVEYDE